MVLHLYQLSGARHTPIFNHNKLKLYFFKECLVNINVYVSVYIHLSKNIDSDQLCYIYLACFAGPADLSPVS